MIAPPDNIFSEDEQFTVGVAGAFIFRVEVGDDGKLVAMAAVEEEEKKHVTLFRFPVEPHLRAIRKWFRAAGIRDIPREQWGATVEEGMFYVDMSGTAIGTDNIPEGMENRTDNMFVLDDITLSVLELPED